MDELKTILVVAGRSPSDHALLDKALRLARGCGAQIHLCHFVVHGVGLEKETAKGEQVWQQSIDDHQGYLEALVARFRAPGIAIFPEAICDQPLSDAILRTVERIHPDLVMKTPAGSHPLRLFTLDFNDWRLARQCPASLMLVHGQPWPQTPRFGALINVSEKAIARLPAAVLHACEYLSLECDGQLDVVYCEPGHKEVEIADRASALDRLLREYHIPPEHVHTLHGDPDSQLPGFVARKRYDILALGAPSHRTGMVALAGGLSSKLVDAADSDLLLVRATSAGGITRGAARLS